jgi:hypothetical protein
MWMRAGLLLAVAAFAVAAYLEFVRDIRTPRSPVIMAGVVGSNYQLSVDRYNAITAAMKDRYGDAAETWLNGKEAVARTKVNGHVVATESIPHRFMDAVGVLLVGADPGRMSIFPFKIGPDRVPDAVAREFMLFEIRERFETTFRPGVLNFTEDDYSVGSCRNMSASELGLGVVGRLVEVGKTTICTVAWRRRPSATMLVGVTTADGGWWVRPFTRGLCTRLARARLDQATDLSRTPNYLACILADRPNALSRTSDNVYEVRKDGVLALIE